MQSVIQENLKVREEAAREARDIVQLHTHKYLTWLKSLSSVSMLKEFRMQMDEIKADEIKRAIAKLDLKNDEENQQTENIIEELANRLAQKFMHQPSIEIRRAGENNETKTLETLANTFKLDQ
jgi:glutamyl-tRNA reductase